MAQVNGITNYWNSPHYEGELWTANAVPGKGTGTPFLTLMGGLNAANMRVVPDFDFVMVNEYDFPAAAQPEIAESDSYTAPDATSPIYSQQRNAVGIYQEAVNVSYKKLSTEARLATDIVHGGVGYIAPEGTPAQQLIAERKSYILQKIARDYNYACINGVYQMSTDTGTASRSRGVLTAATTNAINAAGAELSEALLQQLFRNMAENTNNLAFQNTPLLFVPATQKQNISKIYGNQPNSWNIGGMNIEVILTDFGEVGVVYEPMVNATGSSTDSILFASMDACRPVFNAVVTEKGDQGLLLYEDLAKTGASMKGQFLGHMGIDYAHEKMHGKITGLKRSTLV
jgi:hypothetical protein